MKAILTALALLAITPALPIIGSSTASAESLKLTVENVRNDKGKVIALVFNKPEPFQNADYRRAVGYAAIKAMPGQVQHTFTNLKTGPYAIFLWHDEDNDQYVGYEGQKLLEGIGVSGPLPVDKTSFDKAAVDPGPVTVRIDYGK